MRRFQLVRERDVSGVSGTGIVAEGVVFTDGTTVVRWLHTGRADGVQPTTVVHPDVANVLDLHGHGGSTWVSWLDMAPPSVDLQLPDLPTQDPMQVGWTVDRAAWLPGRPTFLVECTGCPTWSIRTTSRDAADRAVHDHARDMHPALGDP